MTKDNYVDILKTVSSKHYRNSFEFTWTTDFFTLQYLIFKVT